MSFSWTPITALTTVATAGHMNEIQNNTNILADNLGIGRYGWSLLPVYASNPIRAAQVTQLQAALNYIDSQNYCVTNNAAIQTSTYIQLNVTAYWPRCQKDGAYYYSMQTY